MSMQTVTRAAAGADDRAMSYRDWRLEGQTGRTTFTVNYSNSIAPGTPCWVTVVWYNRRGEYSPACAPVQAYLQAGPVAQAA
jgi:hypothetical protein